MFARSAAPEPKTLSNGLPSIRNIARPSEMPPLPGAAAAPPATAPSQAASVEINPMRSAASAGVSRSVIGSDITIAGSGIRITTAGTLEIDGRIDGDVQGTQVIVGESGVINGTIAAEHVTVRGAVNGQVLGRDVILEGRSRVDGDVFHQKLTIAVGAHFEGRSRRMSANAPVTLDTVAQVS